MKKIFSILLCTALIVSLFTGCNTGNKNTTTPETPATPKTETSTTDEKKTYGYITPGPDTWYLRNVEGFQMGATKDGNNVIVLNSDYDVSKEVANIDSMINQGVDGLCIFSFNETGAKMAAQKCKEAGIPLVVTDSCGTVFSPDYDIVAAIDFDWTAMGNDYAQWLADNTPNKDYVILTGSFESVPCQMLNEAMTKKSEELGLNKCLEIRATGYNPSTAVDVAQDLISSGKEFSTFFVMNEDMAAGVIRMLQDKGLADEYTVIAQNGSEAGLPLIKDGSLSYTISSSPGWEGLISYLELSNYINGKNTEVNKPVMLPIMPINKDNIDDPMQVVPWAVDEDVYWKLTEERFPELIK